MTEHALQSFFWPRSIAVLGASPDTHRIRGRLLHQLRENGFPGRILPINPSYQEIGGLRCYASIGAVGEPVDLALVAIPAAGVAPALEECARAGVKNALIISSGFAEEGGAAGDMQAALVEVTRRTGIRACGPNCEGYFNALGKVATTFSPTVEMKEDEGRTLVSGPPRRRDRPVGRHRLRAVQSRQGGGDRLLLRDLDRQRGRSEHGRFPRLHGRGCQHPRGDAVLRSGARRPGVRRRIGKGTAARQADHRDQDRPLRCRLTRIGIAYRIAVRLLHRVSRGVRALRRDRSRGPRRGGGDRRRAGDLPAAEGSPHRHHHAVGRWRRLDGGHAVAARTDRAAIVGGDAGVTALGDAVLWRIRQSGGCDRAGFHHRCRR